VSGKRHFRDGSRVITMAYRLVDLVERPALPPGAVLNAEQAAEMLRRELHERHGIQADPHVGHGVAFVSVWVDLLVWTNGRWFRWAAGRTSASGRPVYAFGPVADVVTVARRVALRHAALQRDHPLSPYLIGDSV
jgi:hypothetical protein